MNRSAYITLALSAVVLMSLPSQSQAYEPGCGRHYVTQRCYPQYECKQPVRRVIVQPTVVVDTCKVCVPLEVCHPVHVTRCREVRVYHHGRCR